MSREKGENVGKRCYLCGAGLPVGEVFFQFGARSVCSDCVDGITAEELMLLTGTGCARAMLGALGFEKNVLF